ncbi:MAG: hypothetical protein Q8K64_06405 [Sediminibacterium sp.]|nr:hypothetical protein [Sediminibacterium sp.]TXT30528.1 MAG: hypothetical protein FD136_1664 [Chitinophagaceae bacterium]
MKIINIFLSIVYFSISVSTKAQDISAKELHYQLTVKSIATNDSSVVDSIGSFVIVDYRIITNGILYFFKMKPREAYLYFNNINELLDDEDSVLLRIDSLSLFNFKDNKKYSLVSEKLGKSIHFQNENNINKTIQQTQNGTSFLQDMLLDKMITPFPQYLGNEFGVTSVKNKTLECVLIKSDTFKYNFSDLLYKVKNFKSTNEKFPLPF